jgi:uncharacterized protein YqeY
MNPSNHAEYGWDPTLDVSLPDKIKQDLKRSLKNKDHAVRDALRQIMSEFPNLTVPVKVHLEDGGIKDTTRPKRPEEITDDEVVGIIQKLVKSEKSVLQAKQEKTSAYLQTLERYLPRMASREEIEAWIEQNIDFTQFKSPMQAMGPIMTHFGKQADGSQVKRILQEMLK